jgi:hypothetical protein
LLKDLKSYLIKDLKDCKQTSLPPSLPEHRPPLQHPRAAHTESEEQPRGGSEPVRYSFLTGQIFLPCARGHRAGTSGLVRYSFLTGEILLPCAHGHRAGTSGLSRPPARPPAPGAPPPPRSLHVRPPCSRSSAATSLWPWLSASLRGVLPFCSRGGGRVRVANNR